MTQKKEGPRYESLPLKFNIDNPQDLIRWDHVKHRPNKQSYIKDLILLDVMFDLFNNETLKKIKESTELDKPKLSE